VGIKRGIVALKKILAIFLVLASVFSFAIAYNQTDKEEVNKMEKAGEGIARQFWIPDDPLLSGPDEMYPLLSEAANESRVNIFRTNIHYRADNRAEILKYVLLTGNTHFFDAFRLKSGRLLTVKDTQQGNSFLSTVNTGDHNQIGIVRDFGGNNLITIKPLKAAYEYVPVAGQYFVEASDNQTFDTFIKSFVAKVNEHYQKYLKVPYNPENFIKHLNNSGAAEVGSGTDFFESIRFMIFVITFVLLIYYIFYQSKRIGIMKMHGLSNICLWFILAGKLITGIFVLSATVSLLVAMSIPDTTSQFVGSVIISQLKTYVIVTASSLISCLYIFRIRVSDAIKNRKDTNGIFALNTLLKAGCSILLLFIGLSIWSQYAKIHTKQENLKSWEHSKDYGVIYPVEVGDDLEDVQHGSVKMTESEAIGLYPVLNRMGAVFIDAMMYEEPSLILNKDYHRIRSIKVNPNYLREFPVYDANNKPVQISEDTRDWILLVPEKYRNRENEIMSFFHKERADTYEAEERAFKRAVPDSVKNQQVRIIWLANDQKIFSFNPEVFPTENNVIIDPIIQVVTEKNSLVLDKANIFSGGGATDPLKIRLINRDTALTLKTLEPELKRLKLDDNLKHLVTVDQYVLQQIYNLQKQVNQLLFISLGLMAGLLLLVVQNLTIFFNKHQRKFIVRRLFGTGFFRTYKEYILLFAVTWGFQLFFCFIVNLGLISRFLQMAASVSTVATASNSSVGTPDTKLLAAAVVLIVIEFVASVIALGIIERKNKVKVLKGGI
jgi:putative ABC transport system permease protein